MNRWTVLLAAIMITLFAAMGCSGGGDNPVAPTTDTGITEGGMHTGQTQTHLWGYYDVIMDIESMTVEAIPVRDAMFAANVVTFLNGNPMGLQFSIISITPGTSDTGVLINVGIAHPLPGMTQYNGYDVRGVFVADGSMTMDYGSGLRYAANGTDQFLNNPDGYTRWFNPNEFRTPGLMGYTPGDFASQGYTGNATLNPYKYYANGLAATSNYWNFLTSTSNNGVFASGATNQRQYDLTFPNTKGVRYGYAVVANWQGEDPGDHPSNAPESVGITVDVTDNIWYVDDEHNGGDFILDVNVFNWGDQPSGLYLESDLIGGSYEFTPAEMIPVGGTGNVSTYHVEVPTTDVTGTEGGEYWIVAEYDGENYTGPFTPPGGAPSATLAAFFRFDLLIADEPYNADPVCDMFVVTEMPVETYGEIDVEFDATGSYDPDAGDTLTFHWDFDGDGTYDEDPDDAYEGDPDNPTHTYTDSFEGQACLWLEDGNGGEAECCDDIDISLKSCGTMTCPSGAPTTMIGSNRLYYWPPWPVQVANTRVIAAYYAYMFTTINVTGTTYYDMQYNNPTYSVYNTAICSDDLMYYRDSGSSNQIYTVQYGSSGFSSIRSSFGTALPSGWYVHHLAVDEDDYPIVFARGPSSNQMRVYRWTGSAWDSGLDVPASIITACGNNYSYVWDFDYDPLTGYYYVVERYNTAGVYAFNDDGDVTWYEDPIWSQVSGTSWQPGIFIDAFDSECRMILMAGMNSPGQTTYWARYNPVGGEKSTGTTSGGTYGTTFSTFDGRGCVQVDTSYGARFMAATYGGNVWSSTPVPNW